MKLIDQVKQRQHRPALIIAGLMLVYLWFFAWPDVARVSRSFWAGLYHVADGEFAQCLWSLAELFCILAGVVIWILSVFVTWAAFRKSRKKAYIFLLAYFLLPLAVQPSSRVIQHVMRKRRLQEYERLQASGQLQPVEADTREPLITFKPRNINLPVGPLLLLAGVWYLYKKEETKDDEPSTARYGVPPPVSAIVGL